jgi:hypothetical protein
LDEDVFELPGIIEIKVVFHQFISLVFKRVPVCVYSNNWRDIRILDLKASLEVHIITLNKTSLWVLESPSHSSNHS